MILACSIFIIWLSTNISFWSVWIASRWANILPLSPSLCLRIQSLSPSGEKAGVDWITHGQWIDEDALLSLGSNDFVKLKPVYKHKCSYHILHIYKERMRMAHMAMENPFETRADAENMVETAEGTIVDGENEAAISSDVDGLAFSAERAAGAPPSTVSLEELRRDLDVVVRGRDHRPSAELLSAYAGSAAANSLRAFRSDISAFDLWCRDKGVSTVPATPESVAGFLAARGKGGAAPTCSASV